MSDLAHTKRYLVQKRFDPDQVPEYRATLSPLSVDEEQVLADEPDRYVVARELTEAEAEEVRRRLHIRSVELDYTATVPEPEVRAQATQSISASQARSLHGIDRVLASGESGLGARVAVIDTGIHPTLAERLGARLVARESFVSAEDWRDTVSLHGTWCISVIAAAAPEAEIVALKGLSTQDGSGSYSGIIKAIERARALGCTHVSMSLGGPASSTLDGTVNAADSAGIIVVVAAGNEQRGTTSYVADQSSPARATGAVTTAAAGSDLSIASFSNWGTCVDASALGVTVQCADPDLIADYWSGTSMATPHLAAIFALLYGKAPKQEVRKAVLSSARDTAEPVHEEGFGFVLANAALAVLDPPEPEYYPGVRRIRKKDVSETPITELDEFVMTFNGEDHGYYEKR
jgi:subtilisin family serine protease